MSHWNIFKGHISNHTDMTKYIYIMTIFLTGVIELSRKTQIEREVWHQCSQLVLSVEQRLQKRRNKK